MYDPAVKLDWSESSDRALFGSRQAYDTWKDSALAPATRPFYKSNIPIGRALGKLPYQRFTTALAACKPSVIYDLPSWSLHASESPPTPVFAIGYSIPSSSTLSSFSQPKDAHLSIVRIVPAGRTARWLKSWSQLHKTRRLRRAMLWNILRTTTPHWTGNSSGGETWY